VPSRPPVVDRCWAGGLLGGLTALMLKTIPLASEGPMVFSLCLSHSREDTWIAARVYSDAGLQGYAFTSMKNPFMARLLLTLLGVAICFG
jgi:hypothetical protein